MSNKITQIMRNTVMDSIYLGMAFPFAAIVFLQATLFFMLIIVRRRYSNQLNKFVDRYLGCGIAEEDTTNGDTDEEEDWLF